MCGTPSVPQEQLMLIKGKEMGQEPGKVHERNAPDSSKATATLPCDVADAGSEKNQHSHRDDDHCHSIASRIEKILRKRAPSNMPREWLDNIPHIAKQLEDKIDSNDDDKTISLRLRELAVYVASRKRKRKRRLNTVFAHSQAQLVQPDSLPSFQQQSLPTFQTCVHPTPEPTKDLIDSDAKETNLQQKKTNLPRYPERSGDMASLSPERKLVCLHQQQRLLLLYHAYSCPYGDNRCPKTEHCGAMKSLWKHIVNCKDRECLVPHCVSSRYVLSHYHKCRDIACDVCIPVRNIIRRSSSIESVNLALQQEDDTNQITETDNGAWPVIPMGRVRVKITVDDRRLKLPPISGSDDKADPKSTSELAEKEDEDIQDAANKEIKNEEQLGPSDAPRSGKGEKFLAQSRQQAKLTATENPAHIIELSRAAKNGTIETHPQMENENSRGPNCEQTPLVQSREHSWDPNLADIMEMDMEVNETHIMTLSRDFQLSSCETARCRNLLETLRTDTHCWLFDTPVDPIALKLPDYYKVITNPMDLGTIGKRLDEGLYQYMEQFEKDIHLTFDNAMLYNKEGTLIHSTAKKLKNMFIVHFEGSCGRDLCHFPV